MKEEIIKNYYYHIIGFNEKRVIKTDWLFSKNKIGAYERKEFTEIHVIAQDEEAALRKAALMVTKKYYDIIRVAEFKKVIK